MMILTSKLQLPYTGVENLSVGGGYFIDNNADAERDVLNLHASYGFGKLLSLLKYTTIDNAAAGENAFLFLADHDFTDKLGGAIRYSEYETGAALLKLKNSQSLLTMLSLTTSVLS